MLNEHKQAVKVIDQLILQPDERCLGVWRDILNDGFAVEKAMCNTNALPTFQPVSSM